MSIIAVDNVPAKMNLQSLVKMLLRPIGGPFEALNFAKSNKSHQYKVCYVRLSPKLDPVHVVQKINSPTSKTYGKYHAFIPDKIPDIQLGTSSKSKSKRLPPALRKKQRIADLNSGGRIINFTTDEIMAELLAKYPRIKSLSEKFNHQLLQDIAKTIASRVEVLVSRSPDLEESCFLSTRAYRRAHPHSGDFQLVSSALHAIQDAERTPRQELQESELTSSINIHKDLEIPVEKGKSLCDKYTAKILAKMSEHVSGLDSTLHQMDTEEEIARKQVRLELKKLQPFLNLIVSQVVSKQFLPEHKKFIQMRIYGEPFLPNKDTMKPFLARFKPRKPLRSMRMFNMLMLSVAPSMYQQLVAMTGTVLNGAKLIIASSKEVRSSCWNGEGEVEGEGDSDDEQMEDEQDEQENWVENEMEM